MDYKQAIIREIDTLPAELLPQIHRLLHDFQEQKLSVYQVLARADAIAAERKTWTRQQHIQRLLEIAEELRQEAIAKGVAIDRDEEAALES
jgi:tRNA A37 N6-isopentenylltransferase MiaA